MPPPLAFASPASRGSAMNPLLLALYHAAPGLRRAVLQKTDADKGTLTRAVRQVWEQLEAGGPVAEASAVWNLIGEEKLLPIDAAELLSMMCDLFDAELSLAARESLGVATKTTVKASASAAVSEGSVQHGYRIPLSLPRGAPEVSDASNMDETVRWNFRTERVDFTFPGEIEPVESEQAVRIVGALHECVVLHLQRYQFDFSSMSTGKIYDRLEFKQSVDGGKLLGPFVADAADARSVGDMQLVAVVVHDDELGFSVLLKSSDDGAFYKCCHQHLDQGDDDPPSKVDDLAAYFGGQVGQEVAYLLFYANKAQAQGAGALANAVRKVSQAAARKSVPKAATATATATTTALAVAAPAAPSSGAAAASKADGGGGGGCCLVQ